MNINMVLVDCDRFQPIFHENLRVGWAELDPAGRIQVLLPDVPVPEEWERDEASWSLNPIELTQMFVMKHALRGSLWEIAASDMRKAPIKGGRTYGGTH